MEKPTMNERYIFNWNMVTIPFSDEFLFNLWGIEIWRATSDENIKA